MACDLNKDANFTDSGIIDATKWGKYNCSPAIHCAGMACLSLGFSAAAIDVPIVRAHYRECLLLQRNSISDHAWLLYA